MNVNLFTVSNIKKNYLVVFFQDVVHFSHIFTRNGLDDVSFVVGCVESGSAACLGIIGQGCAPGQGVLPVGINGKERREPVKNMAFRFPNNLLSSQIFKNICVWKKLVSRMTTFYMHHKLKC